METTCPRSEARRSVSQEVRNSDGMSLKMIHLPYECRMPGQELGAPASLSMWRSAVAGKSVVSAVHVALNSRGMGNLGIQGAHTIIDYMVAH
jgi:hypothetical protein